MIFQHYTITAIDEKTENISVSFIYDDNGKQVVVDQVLNYGSDMKYMGTETKKVAEQYFDAEGKIKVREVEKEVRAEKIRKSFDVTDEKLLDSQLISYGIDYAVGLEEAKSAKVTVSDAVKNLVKAKKTNDSKK
jgi:hypothetical protein